MEFITKLTTGIEVIQVKFENKTPEHHYAHKPSLKLEKGRWRIDLTKFDLEISRALTDKSFGSSINRFMFGFEMADFESWGDLFTKSATYVSYRPKDKTLLCVGQLNWSDVKNKSAKEQLDLLQHTIIESINRAAVNKRKPKYFNHLDFSNHMKLIFNTLELEKVIASPIT